MNFVDAPLSVRIWGWILSSLRSALNSDKACSMLVQGRRRHYPVDKTPTPHSAKYMVGHLPLHAYKKLQPNEYKALYTVLSGR
jgi:hypothetical protein